MLVVVAASPTALGALALPAPGMLDAPCPVLPARPAELDARTELDLRPERPDPAVSPRALEPATLAYLSALDEQRKGDWANLCRFQADDAVIARGSSARVVFLGDSITENWLLADPSLFADGIVNRGISGQTSPQMLVRFYADVVALHPGVVHIMAGTNDLAGNTGPTSEQQYENNIMAMCDLARANGIRVVLASIPPAATFPWRSDLRPGRQITELNAWLRRYAAQRGLIYVDYYAALADKDGAMRADLSHDGVHPQRAGYTLMRPLAERAIAAASGVR
jgi:lysophospholipase L1-like esterase